MRSLHHLQLEKSTCGPEPEASFFGGLGFILHRHVQCLNAFSTRLSIRTRDPMSELTRTGGRSGQERLQAET
ncbi:MAG: hypothetical protein A2Y74_07170 [Actinobacteria bacterium RBG_13_63_9]|nr:MAG: hypothetical protein A2Y74_07170 [Actinobacteria bacterium RBG_13_63_9]